MATSYWCYSCSRFIRAHPGETISCPECHGGFIEEIGSAPPVEVGALHRHHRSSSGDESILSARRVNLGSRRRRGASVVHRSPFNPVIVLRGSAGNGSGNVLRTNNGGSNFELFYDDGAGTGLRPLPESMYDYLMGSGFDQLLDQLSRTESTPVGGLRSCENIPASKTAVESLPTISIADDHICINSQCAICMEAFELGGEAQEMPCKHIFHGECILPWLSLKNSCPVCRHELPADPGRTGESFAGQAVPSSDDSSAGLTIWRLSSGGFAVGRFSGARRDEDHEFPMIYTNINGTFGSGNMPRRILWPSNGNRSGDHRGIGRMVHNLFSMFRCFNSSSSALPASGINFSSTSDGSQV